MFETNGILKKSFDNSFIVSCDLTSNVGGKLLSNYPSYNKESVVILQIMLVGNTIALFEIIPSDQFNGLSKEGEE